MVAPGERGIADVAGQALAGMGNGHVPQDVRILPATFRPHDNSVVFRCAECKAEHRTDQNIVSADQWLMCDGKDMFVRVSLDAYADLAAALPAAPGATPTADRIGEHVAYAEDGKLHWMSGRKFQNCELYTRATPTARNPAAQGDYSDADRTTPAFMGIALPLARNPAAADWAAPGGADVVAVLREICEMQAKNYGNGTNTHLGLIDLAKRGREALAAAQPVAAPSAAQLMVNLAPDVILALRNTSRRKLADMMEVALRELKTLVEPVAAPAGAHVGAQDNLDAERAAFHKYAGNLPLAHRLTLDRGSNLIGGQRVWRDAYGSAFTTAAWYAWKARAAIARATGAAQ